MKCFSALCACVYEVLAWKLSAEVLKNKYNTKIYG